MSGEPKHLKWARVMREYKRTRDAERVLSHVHNEACELAEASPVAARRRIAHQLRETARLIEGM